VGQTRADHRFLWPASLGTTQTTKNDRLRHHRTHHPINGQ
jgi:hypothetical protein